MILFQSISINMTYMYIMGLKLFVYVNFVIKNKIICLKWLLNKELVKLGYVRLVVMTEN